MYGCLTHRSNAMVWSSTRSHLRIVWRMASYSAVSDLSVGAECLFHSWWHMQITDSSFRGCSSTLPLRKRQVTAISKRLYFLKLCSA